jgi:hypothetical protein
LCKLFQKLDLARRLNRDFVHLSNPEDHLTARREWVLAANPAPEKAKAAQTEPRAAVHSVIGLRQPLFLQMPGDQLGYLKHAALAPQYLHSYWDFSAPSYKTCVPLIRSIGWRGQTEAVKLPMLDDLNPQYLQ